MPTIVLAIVALVGATFQSARGLEAARPGARIEIYLVWWLAVAVGVGSLVTTGYHLFDGPTTAELIGYARG